MTEVVTSFASRSWPALRWKLTQSPPSDSRPLWHFPEIPQIVGVDHRRGELTRL